MSLTTTLAACNTNPALNGPDGADLPSTLDDQIRLALSFIAQLRDGAGIPVGTVAAFPSQASAPTGWLKLNGALISRATYAALWVYAQAASPASEAAWASTFSGAFSVGDGSTTFRIPDYRAMFLRGNDDSRGIDTSRNVGSFQDHSVAFHAHAVTDPGHAHVIADPGHTHGGASDGQGAHQHDYQATAVASGAGAGVGGTTVYALNTQQTAFIGNHSHNITIGTSGTGVTVATGASNVTVNGSGSEGRPKNVATVFCIKY